MPIASAQTVAAEATPRSRDTSAPNAKLAQSERLLLAQRGLEVQDDDALRQLKSAEVKPEAVKPKVELPTPFSLAKAMAPATVAAADSATKAQTAGPTAASMLQGAQNLQSSGDRVGAALGYFQILD